jgi:hypothetical protein
MLKKMQRELIVGLFCIVAGGLLLYGMIMLIRKYGLKEGIKHNENTLVFIFILFFIGIYVIIKYVIL